MDNPDDLKRWEGKLPPQLLKQLVLEVVSRKDPRVLVGPSIGEDAAIIDFGDRVLVVHSDPITGAVKNIGWYAVHVACNDIATRGARPQWLLPVVLLPIGEVEAAKQVAKDIRRAADEVGAVVVGGHTEFAPGLNRPIVSMTAIGEAPKNGYVTTSMCRPGDKVILTKGVAIEGTAIIAAELEHELKGRIPQETLESAKSFTRYLSVVKDALTAVEAGGVHAMHDPTEGGVAGGLQELAIASQLGIIAYEEKMIIRKETQILLSTVGADPLKTISSGSLLIAAEPNAAPKIVEKLNQVGIPASIIGEIIEDSEKRYIVRKDGSKMSLHGYIADDLWKTLSQHLSQK